MRQNDDRARIAAAVEDFCDVVTTDAAQEGIRAFLEKRAPNW
jgi:enoyl-CoA hydratase